MKITRFELVTIAAGLIGIIAIAYFWLGDSSKKSEKSITPTTAVVSGTDETKKQTYSVSGSVKLSLGE